MLESPYTIQADFQIGLLRQTFAQPTYWIFASAVFGCWLWLAVGVSNNIKKVLAKHDWHQVAGCCVTSGAHQMLGKVVHIQSCRLLLETTLMYMITFVGWCEIRYLARFKGCRREKSSCFSLRDSFALVTAPTPDFLWHLYQSSETRSSSRTCTICQTLRFFLCCALTGDLLTYQRHSLKHHMMHDCELSVWSLRRTRTDGQWASLPHHWDFSQGPIKNRIIIKIYIYR